MIPPADPIGARPLRGVEPIAPVHSASDPQRELFNRLAHIALGKTFQAEVLTKLDDGTHLVKIDNASFKAVLPGDPKVGDFLALKFVAAGPRPTFLLTPQNTADTASLSSAAKLLGTILEAGAHDAEAAVLVGKSPLLPGAADDASAIASSLKNALSSSGAFYESHLRQWLGGARTLAELQQEAQTRPGMPTAQGANVRIASNASAEQAVTVVSEWDSTMPAVAQAGNASTGSMDMLSKESMHLVNAQLQALEHGKIVWHGELWPGQRLEWEVDEDRSQTHAEDETASSWSSTVRFTLPTLGVVCAQIHLSDNRVQMHLRAAREQTASLLTRHGTELATALDAVGSPMETFSVKQDDAA